MNYATIGTDGNLMVIDENKKVCGGPYKNDESAKRRIRDLRRKEISAGVHDNLVTPSVETGTGKNNIANAEKLAMSSEYGKSKPFTVTPINGFEIHETNPAIAPHLGYHPRLAPSEGVERQRGVYPAISKHAYRR